MLLILYDYMLLILLLSAEYSRVETQTVFEASGFEWRRLMQACSLRGQEASAPAMHDMETLSLNTRTLPSRNNEYH